MIDVFGDKKEKLPGEGGCQGVSRGKEGKKYL
jgi:hypothetical protein